MNGRTYGSRALQMGPVLLVVCILACGSDKTGPAEPPITTVPASWKGVWPLHVRATLCGTNYIIRDTTITENICVGDTIGLPAGLDFSVYCTGGSISATATSIHFSCSHALEDSGCTGTVSVRLDIGVNGSAGTIAGTGRVYLDRSPNSTQCQDICVDLVFSGTRVPNQEPTCPPTRERLRKNRRGDSRRAGVDVEGMSEMALSATR